MNKPINVCNLPLHKYTGNGGATQTLPLVTLLRAYLNPMARFGDANIGPQQTEGQNARPAQGLAFTTHVCCRAEEVRTQAPSSRLALRQKL